MARFLTFGILFCGLTAAQSVKPSARAWLATAVGPARTIVVQQRNGVRANARVIGPFRGATNISADILGPVDTRESTWGNAGYVIVNVAFKPPEGFRVRLLQISGDIVAWPRVLPAEPPVEKGRYAGVLFGLQTTAANTSDNAEWVTDNCMLYVQGAMDDKPTRIPISEQVDTILEPDNVLVMKVAAWLNTTGYPIHIEPTMVITYQFERNE